ncbi:MAG: lytic transglycosylase domain-containing protein [Firmicutes bacterium]|nr:lytic transglycosylase domain-containing protein [Bacillota bacterium]
MINPEAPLFPRQLYFKSTNRGGLRVHTFRTLILILVLLAALIVGLKPFLQWSFPLYFSALIKAQSEESGLDPLLLAAVIKVESGFQPQAVSSKGAVGLMQIMPETAFWLGEQQGLVLSKKDLFQPERNLGLGSFYLKSLLREFPSEEAALAAYNAGPNNVRRWINEGLWDGSLKNIDGVPFAETRAYVRKVDTAKRIFRYLYRRELLD